MAVSQPVIQTNNAGLLGFFDGTESSSAGGTATAALAADLGPALSVVLGDQDNGSVGFEELSHRGVNRIHVQRISNRLDEDDINYRLHHLPWVALTESDAHVLESTLVSLKSRLCANVLSGARFFKDVLARDFPAEVFLQRSGLLACLIGLAAGGSGGKENSTELIAAEMAVDALLLFSDRLAERIRQALDPDCHVPPSAFLSRRKNEHCETAAAGVDEEEDNGSAADEAEEEFDQYNDELLTVDSELQWSVPRCAIELTSVAISWLGRTSTPSLVEAEPNSTRPSHSSSSSPSTRRLQLALAGARLLTMCLPNSSNASNYSTMILSDRLVGLLDLWSIVLYQRSMRDEVAAPASVALAWRRIYAALLPALIDIAARLVSNTNGGCVSEVVWQRLPRSMRQELSEVCRCEASLLGLSNHRRRQLLSLLTASSLGLATSDCLVERRQLDTLAVAMSAVCRFLRRAPLATNAELIELLEVSAPLALPAVGVAGCVGFVVQFVQAYSRAVANFIGDDAFSCTAGRNVLLGLLAHKQATLRKRAYATCLFVLQTALSVDAALQPGSCEFRRARFLLDRDVLYQISMFGLDSDGPPEVREMAQELLCRVLESRPYTDADTWRKVVDTCLLVLPALQAHTDLETGFGRCLLSFCGTKSGPIADAMSRLQRMRACLRLLYSPDVDVRREGIARACTFLTAETDSDAKQPVFLDVNLKHMMNLVYVDQQARQLECPSTLEPTTQIDGLNKVYEIFRRSQAEGGVDPAVRKSAGEQVSIFLQNPGLHRHFIVNLAGLQYTLDLMQQCLRRDEAYLSMVLPACVSILRRLALLNREIRRLLAEDYSVYSTCVRAALHLNYDSAFKSDISQLLALLLFDEMTPAVPKTVPGANDFCLPAGLTRRFRLPFRCSTYDLANPHTIASDSSAAAISSLTGQRSLRLLWNLAWQAGGDPKLLLSMADKQPNVLEDYSELMRLSELDWNMLRASWSDSLAIEAIQHLASATDHYSAGCAVDKLTVCRLMTQTATLDEADANDAVANGDDDNQWDDEMTDEEDDNNNEADQDDAAVNDDKVQTVGGSNSPSWTNAADRFVRVRPASSADYRLLCRLLDLLLSDMASKTFAENRHLLNWLLVRLAPPDGVLLYIVAMGDALVCDTDSERLAEAKRGAWRASVALAGAVADCLAVRDDDDDSVDVDAASTFVSTMAFYLVRRLLAGKHLTQLAQLHDCLSALRRLTSAATIDGASSSNGVWNWASACPLQSEDALRLACLDAAGQVMDSLLRDRADIRDSFMGHGSILCVLGLLRNLAADCQGQGQQLPLTVWKIPINWTCILVASRHQLLTAASLDLLACLCRISDAFAAAVHAALETAEVSADGAWGLGLALLRPAALGCSPLVRSQACDLLASLVAMATPADNVEQRLATEGSTLVRSLARQLLAYWPESELPPRAIVLPAGRAVRQEATPGVCTPRLLASICRLLQNLCCFMPKIWPAELAELKVTSLLIGLLDPGLLEQCARAGQPPDRLAQPACAVLRLLRLLACDDVHLRARLLHDDRLLGRLVRLLRLRWDAMDALDTSDKRRRQRRRRRRQRPPQATMLRLWTEACQTLTLLTYGRDLGRVDPGAVNHVAAALANRLPACLSALTSLLNSSGSDDSSVDNQRLEGSRSALLLCHAVFHSPDLRPLLDAPRSRSSGEGEAGEDGEGTSSASVASSDNLGARFAHRLLRRYDVLWTLPSSSAVMAVGIAEDRAVLTAALKMLLLTSRTAKSAALNAGFVEALLETLRRPNLTWQEARQTAELLQNLMHSMPEAKLAAASSANSLADRLHRLWPIALTQPALMLAFLRLLAVLTAPPPSRCSGLTAGLIQALLRLAGQDNQLWREADLIRRACFSVLSNAALTSSELRSSLVKSRFLDRFYTLPSGEQQLSKAAKSAAADWLRLLANLSVSPEGQVALLSQPACLQKLCELATTNDLRRQCRALLCLRNLACHPGLRMRILACQQQLTDCLQSALQACQRLLRNQRQPNRPKLRSVQQQQQQQPVSLRSSTSQAAARETRVLALTVSLLRSLMHANQRARAQLRNVAGLKETLASIFETLLASVSVSTGHQLLDGLSPEEAAILMRDLKLALAALQP